MSSNIVKTCIIDKISPHSNADKIELAVVGGWQCCVLKGKYKAGDLITYIPPDSVLPLELSERIGVTKYLNKGRIVAVRLRGEYSFGLIIDPVGNEGDNVAERLSITKYQPPFDYRDKDAESSHSVFYKYSDIENMRNFPTVFQDGEEVIVTEKIHGKNLRLGFILNDDGSWIKIAGGRNVQRKNIEGSLHWIYWSKPEINSMLAILLGKRKVKNQVIIFGELYGTQNKMRYGVLNNVAFSIFDVMIDGKYCDWDETLDVANQSNAETVPVIYRGPFSLAKIAELSSGQSTIPGANHIREGVVVRAVNERTDEKIGRAILKYVSNDYLCGNFDASSE